MTIAERRREEKEQRRIDIIDAAERVFSRKGFEDTTMADIAREARLSRALLYVYFEDKDDLNLAITHRAYQALYKAFTEAAARHEQGLDKIQAIGEAYIRFSETQPYYFDQLARYESKTADLNNATINELACLQVGQTVLHLMAEALRQGVGDGSIRADLDDPLQTAVTLWGMTHGVIQIAEHRSEGLELAYGIDLGDLKAHVIEMAGRALRP